VKATDLFFTPETVPLPVSRSRRYQMARDGELPVIRCGKRLLIPRAAFQKWLETCGTSCPSTRSALEDPKRAEMMRR